MSLRKGDKSTGFMRAECYVRRDGTVATPARTYETGTDGVPYHSRNSRPLADRMRFVFGSDVNIVNTIVLLDRGQSPSQVSWLVVAVIVLAVQCMLWRRSAANIRQKLIKRIESKFNSTTAVTGVAPAFNVSASTFCFEIRSVFWRFLSSGYLTMRRARNHNSGTAARSCAVLTQEYDGRNALKRAAIASAEPNTQSTALRAGLLSDVAKYFQLTKDLTLQILKQRVGGFWLKRNVGRGEQHRSILSLYTCEYRQIGVVTCH